MHNVRRMEFGGDFEIFCFKGLVLNRALDHITLTGQRRHIVGQLDCRHLKGLYYATFSQDTYQEFKHVSPFFIDRGRNTNFSSQLLH